MMVDLAEALVHLRLAVAPVAEPEEHEDAGEVTSKLAQAQAIVIDYIEAEDHEWDADSVPGPVKAAILLVLSDLWDHRSGSANEDVFLSTAVKSLLRRYRDPALA